MTTSVPVLALYAVCALYIVFISIRDLVKLIRYWRNPSASEMKSLTWVLEVALLVSLGQSEHRWPYIRLMRRKPFTAERMAAAMVAEVLGRDSVKIARLIERTEAYGSELTLKGFIEGWDEDDD